MPKPIKFSFVSFLFTCCCSFFFFACQQNEPKTFGYFWNSGISNFSRTDTSDCQTFVKFDTAYADTSIRKNTNYRVFNLVTSTPGIFLQGTIAGVFLKVPSGVPITIARTVISATEITDVYVYTVTSTTLTAGCKLTSTPVVNIVKLNRNLPAVLPKPTASQLLPDSLPKTAQSAKDVIVRNGSQDDSKLGTITGSLLGGVPADIVRLLTQENKELASLLPTDTVKGWLVYQLSALQAGTGKVNDVTDRITVSMQKSIAGIYTYFPDGYYTYITTSDSASYNQMGWYQIAMVNNLPVGIVYAPLKAGQYFTDSPQFPGQLKIKTFGHGIWGISKSNYFPIFRVGPRQQVILSTVSVKY